MRRRDRLHLQSWEPTVPGSWNDNNAALAWPGQWSTLRALARRGLTLPFVITVDGELAGQVTVGNIVRGSLCSAWVGYWVGTHATAGGVATGAVALVVGPLFRRGRPAPARGDRAAGEPRERPGAHQARLPRGGPVPPLPRRRRGLA